MCATSRHATERVGVPFTAICASTSSRSSGAASITWAAISIALARTTAHASRHELLAMTAVPLPPVPRPNAVAALSP